MRFAALATDYDGTLAEDGTVSSQTLDGVRRFRRAGRRVILVTGRTLSSLLAVFRETKEFDCIVAENGATLYDPSSGSEEVLLEKPPASFVSRLRAKGVFPLELGRVIVATLENQQEAVLDAIRELGLELHIIFNKGSLMILPSGANKATGLQVAVDRLSLSTHNVAGIGDAENDHAFLAACEFSTAVANALPTLKERVHLVTRHAAGAGVVELMDEILADDLCPHAARFGQLVNVGHDDRGQDVKLSATGVNLILGPSGAGKSTVTAAFLEGLASAKYQFCVLDAEGEYEMLEHTVLIGDSRHAAKPADVIKALDQPSCNVIANLLPLELDQRPIYFRTLLLGLEDLRNRVGRPHCIVVDEAHHFLSANDLPGVEIKDNGTLSGTTLIAVHPDRLPPPILARVQTLIVAGQDALNAIEAFCKAAGIPAPQFENLPVERGQMLAWQRGSSKPVVFSPASTRAIRIRHRRKYAEGEIAPDRSFYFRGSDGKLNLRAYNLITFLNLMEGVDEETWLFHLRNGDYSAWFRKEIKDEDLAREAEIIEKQGSSAGETRKQMHELITGRYTLPE